ncbi:ATPase with role in protein import into the ER [Podila humilis]|nr:ATPase with role in protein import into the ER [Podila humilis]
MGRQSTATSQIYYSKGLSNGRTCIYAVFLLLLMCLLGASCPPNESEYSSTYGTVVGIDFGTTHSCVGVVKNKTLEIIASDQGSRCMPSYVAFTKNGILIGEAARDQMAENPTNTIYGVKHLFGLPFHDKHVQEAIKDFPFKVIEKNNETAIEINLQDQPTQWFTPIEIASMVLHKLKETAGAHLGEEIRFATITVPPYFKDAQRQATKDAADLAGLNILRTINEPTAAAIGYELERKMDEATIIVYDLSTHSLDITVLYMDSGIYELLATRNHPHLGGENFSQRVVDHFVQQYQEKDGNHHHHHIDKSPQTMDKLKRHVERAKRILSTEMFTQLKIDSFHDGNSFSETLTREQFENLNMDLFKKTIEEIDNVLVDAGGLHKKDVDCVLLVGGSSWIPKISSILEDYFDGEKAKILRTISPDESVVYGAAFQGAILSDERDHLDTFFPFDFNLMSLGIETVGGVMNKLIPRWSFVPSRKSINVTTLFDNQSQIRIRVFEGERTLTKDNQLLHEMVFSDITPASRGVPRIEVKLEIDANLVLHLTAMDLRNTSMSKHEIISNYTMLDFMDTRSQQDDQAVVGDQELKEQREAMVNLEQSLYLARSRMGEETNDAVDEAKLYEFKPFVEDVQGDPMGQETAAIEAEVVNELLLLTGEEKTAIMYKLRELETWFQQHGFSSTKETLDVQHEELASVFQPLVDRVKNQRSRAHFEGVEHPHDEL